MTDKTLVNEIALNSREVSHPEWGTFIISRPTNRILSDILTARTRSLNRDLQEREKVYDPSTGNYKLVPAFLTKQGKRKILEEFGDWTKEDEQELVNLEKEYRDACVALEQEGFEGTAELHEAYQEALETLKELLEKKPEDFEEELPVLFPMDYEDDSLDPNPEEYAKARQSVERKAKDIDVVSVLQVVDRLHKQYEYLMKGITAQSQLYVKKVEELTLFADTAESRADKEAQLVKIQRCAKNLDKSPVWSSVDECQNESPDKLTWLLGEIEKFERLDPSVEKSTSNKANKYNFLFPILGTQEDSEEPQETQESNQDGESVAKTE